MINQLGPVLIFLSPMFLISGLIHFFMLRRQKNKYPAETSAVISSCRAYKMDKGGGDIDLYQALILDFTVDNKNYKIRQDIGKEMIGRRMPKKLPYAVGQQVKIFYNPENPNKIDVEINNSRKVSDVMWRVFLCSGLIGLLVGIYLTFYSN